ncbi:Uncharacterised protein [Legionella beliardensis]|uniref:DUF3757 domain-containing protein n=1 Tax=Legionella beliardensis TaxID=91822 RepID=A0A378I1V5_9GAMM|nr:DUF3757 domain-containing protein [Legionella beliardensis]STX28691.1 Uncharacterised protein [Legionella beliardensis]
MKAVVITTYLIANLFYSLAYASSNCPDPKTSSLQWGEIPEPWQLNPFSEHKPQGDVNTQFARANIMVYGGYGHGVICTYRNSIGNYSIWWPVLVKIPARVDYNWIDTLGGYVCTESLTACQFYTAN